MSALQKKRKCLSGYALSEKHTRVVWTIHKAQFKLQSQKYSDSVEVENTKGVDEGND